MQTETALKQGIQLDGNAAAALRAVLRGEIIGPDSPEYEQARRVYNGMIDKHPALIVRCADVSDVISTVNFATGQRRCFWPCAAADTAARDWESATAASCSTCHG